MRFHEIIAESIPAYHGTDRQFRAFKMDRIGSGYDANLGGVGFLGRGFYFTPSQRKAADYGRRVVPVMLDLKNPLEIGKGSQWSDIHAAVEHIAGHEVHRSEFQTIARQAGYDGIIRHDFHYPDLDEIVVFDPKQIRIVRKP